MRILLVIDNLSWGGAQRQMANLGAGLARRGHDVDLFTYNPGHDHVADLLEEAGVRVVSAAKRERIGVNVLWGLIRHMRRTRFDAAVAFMPTPATYAAIAARAAGRVPLVASDRSSFPPGRIPLETRLRRQPYRWARHVTANSFNQRDDLVKRFPWLWGRVSTIWNGIDMDQYRPPEQRPPVPPGSQLRLLGVGTVRSVKNLEGLARALVVLAEQGGPVVTVNWAGMVLDEPEPRAIVSRVESILTGAGLRGQWRWLGLRKDIPELLGGCDALVHPSWYEGLPNAVCESLACGTPVLASRTCDHPLLVAEGETGFLFDAARPESIADAIAQLVAVGESARHTMGVRARAFAERELALDVFVSRYEDLLQRLASERGR